jgi:RNA polymerase sigma factor (sigma-70 family)
MGRDPTREREFRVFVAERSARLQRTAYLLTGDWALAQALVVNALSKTYRAASPAWYVYSLRVLVSSAPTRRAERPTDRTDLIWERIGELPRDQRAVVVLRYFEDLTEQQTAEVLGIPETAVKQRTAQALRTLSRRPAGRPVAIGGVR